MLIFHAPGHRIRPRVIDLGPIFLRHGGDHVLYDRPAARVMQRQGVAADQIVEDAVRTETIVLQVDDKDVQIVLRKGTVQLVDFMEGLGRIVLHRLHRRVSMAWACAGWPERCSTQPPIIRSSTV